MPRHYKNVGKFGLETASPVSQNGPVGEAKPAMQLFDPVKVDERLKTPESLLQEYYAFSIHSFADKLSNDAIDKSLKYYSERGELRLDVNRKDYLTNINNYNTYNYTKSRVAGRVKQLMEPGQYFSKLLNSDPSYQQIKSEDGIDMPFWAAKEKVVPFAYIPAGGNSGVTLMDGIDLSSCKDLQTCLGIFEAAGLSGESINKLKPFLGLRGQQAETALKEYYNKYKKPLQLPWKESVSLSAQFHKKEKIPFVVRAYEKGLVNKKTPSKTIPKPENNDPFKNFDNLPDYWKTAYYLMGAQSIWSPNFTKQLRKGQFENAKTNLANWGGGWVRQQRAQAVLAYINQKEAENAAQVMGAFGDIATNL